MAQELTDHPSREQLLDFAAGRLEPSEQSRVERHVQDCAPCCDVLRDGPEDTLVERLRDADTSFGSVPPNRTDETPADENEIPVPLRDHPRYRILRRIGGGGMGVVYKAEHRLMGRPVALKVINPDLMDNSEAVVRFRTEVKAAASLDHPNIVRAFDAEQADDLHFLVMEFVDGISLAELIHKRGPMSIPQACIATRKIAFGLQHAGQLGMVHRDIKPQNVMVTRAGQIKILDFGLARLARHSSEDTGTHSDIQGHQRSESALTRVGSLLGTPDYIAPEQADDSHTVDVRADIYSLGCTLYCMLAGRPPFPRGSTLQKLVSHREHQPQCLSNVRDDVPGPLVEAIQKMMAKDPSDRYQTPAEVAEALLPFARSTAATAAESPGPTALADVVAELEEHAASKPLTTEFDLLPPRRRPALSDPALRRDSANSQRQRRIRLITGAAVAVVALAVWLPFSGIFGGANSSPASGNGTPDDMGKSERAPQSNSGGPAAKPQPPRILFVIPHDGFWNLDYEPLRLALEGEGARVFVASSARSAATPFPNTGKERPVVPNLALTEAKTGDYDAVVFTGQCVNAANKSEYLGKTQHARDAQKFMRRMLAERKIVMAVCGGTNVLADAGVLVGRPAAYHKYIDGVWNRSGGMDWQYDQKVVVSNRIITTDSWEEPDLYAQTLLRELAKIR